MFCTIFISEYGVDLLMTQMSHQGHIAGTDMLWMLLLVIWHFYAGFAFAGLLNT